MMKSMCPSSVITIFSSLLLVIVLLSAGTTTVFVRGDGFNAKRIQYFNSLPRAIDEAKDKQKPILLLVHKTWCPACKQLRKKFEASAEIEALSEHFVMVNAEDDDEPSDEKYAPNGSYSPRILFLSPDGEPLPITNAVGSDPSSPHFYATAPELVRGMVTALHHTAGISHLDEL